MSESKQQWTPGPWEWDDRYPSSNTGEKTWSLIGANGYGILSCDGEENSPQGLNDDANAKLIAAAPELVEALQAIAQYGSDTLSGRIDGPDDREWQREAVLEMTRRARAALAKAGA
ncbi:hypothetical protein [Burkholderia gladioli]|uniref:hypothetical protein n=1 Tax=Burkholderia gladioli TaxID=28095 RepID=UPI0015E76559|nr:hypothetical protein [Burkholderia gladioli]MBA1366795.1 hypothetical protein [Burkholderia gladioli]